MVVSFVEADSDFCIGMPIELTLSCFNLEYEW
jgi:hypothetical protein